MASLNQVNLLGNLTRDPEIRYTPSGMAVANFGIAVNRKWRDSKTNEIREEVTFVDLQVWGKVGENCHKYLTKGSQALVVGRLKLEQWDDKQTGAKRSKIVVVGEQVTFLNSKRTEGDGGGQQRQQRPPAQQQQRRAQPAAPPPGQEFGEDEPAPVGDLDIPEENIPF